MLPGRWSHLARHGLLGTTLLTIASTRASASPCDDVDDRVIGFVIGLDLTPKTRLVGGIEARACIDDKTEGFARLELGGGTRLMFGARARPLENGDFDTRSQENLGLEAGLVLGTQSLIGAHLAATYGTNIAYLAAQAMFPLNKQDRPTRGTLLFGLSPSGITTGTTVEGRPLIHDGHIVRPAIAALPFARTAEDRAVRDHFASSAQFEYSSVWTFLRLAAELAAVGAPDQLIARALDAADDEVRHAAMCARAAGSLELSPLAMACAQPRFASRSAHALETLAVEAWLEGCLNEGAAAEEARLMAAETDDDTVGKMLATIARDERRHAELSWAVLGWLHEVAPAIASAAIAGSPTPVPQVERAGDPALVRRGVPSSQITAAALAHAVADAQVQLRALA